MNVSLYRALLQSRIQPFSVVKSSYALRTYRPRNHLNRVSALRLPFLAFRRRYSSYSDPDDDRAALIRKLHFQKDASKAFVWTIIGGCTIVFAGWQYATWPTISSADRAPVYKFLTENFLLSSAHLRAGHWWTMITAGFSHRHLWHFAFNMMSLHAVSQILIYQPGFGPVTFASLWFGSVLSGSAAFISHRKSSNDPRDAAVVGLGASGGVSGIVAAAALIAPRTPMMVFFIPMPLWVAALGYYMVDSFFVVGGLNSPIAHDAHAGGAMFGALFYVLRLRRFGGVFGTRPF
jgi:membrane associated rhomboid family serine protease